METWIESLLTSGPLAAALGGVVVLMLAACLPRTAAELLGMARAAARRVRR